MMTLNYGGVFLIAKEIVTFYQFQHHLYLSTSDVYEAIIIFCNISYIAIERTALDNINETRN